MEDISLAYIHNIIMIVMIYTQKETMIKLHQVVPSSIIKPVRQCSHRLIHTIIIVHDTIGWTDIKPSNGVKIPRISEFGYVTWGFLHLTFSSGSGIWFPPGSTDSTGPLEKSKKSRIQNPKQNHMP